MGVWGWILRRHEPPFTLPASQLSDPGSSLQAKRPPPENPAPGAGFSGSPVFGRNAQVTSISDLPPASVPGTRQVRPRSTAGPSKVHADTAARRLTDAPRGPPGRALRRGRERQVPARRSGDNHSAPRGGSSVAWACREIRSRAEGAALADGLSGLCADRDECRP